MTNKLVCAAFGALVLGLASALLRDDGHAFAARRQDPQPQQQPAPKAQEPQPASDRPAQPPADAKPLRTIEEPYIEPVQRGDLPERYSARDPLEGIYSVKDRFVAGQPVPPGRGYMVVGRRHLVVHFEAPGPKAGVPLVRAQVFTWSRADNTGMVRMASVLGHFNDEDGDMLLEQPGAVQFRRFELRQDVLRVQQDGGSWIDFVRVE